MDDEPMWDTDRVVALTPGSAITIPETTNEFAIKGNHLTLRYRERCCPPDDVSLITYWRSKSMAGRTNELLKRGMNF
ncbi:hypothetical protein Tco_1161947 [Tanacetum coccineum]